jgi:hypothetical protein
LPDRSGWALRPGAPLIECKRTAASRPTARWLLSEAVLAEDWNRPEEDEAWAHLQPAR